MRLVEQVLPVIMLSFIIFGTIGNILTFFLLIRQNVRKHSSMRYLAALCLVDTCCLYTWNFSGVYKFFMHKKIEHENEVACRLFSFFSYFILQASSWIIVAIGFDRLLTFVFKKENTLTKLIHNTRFLIAFTLSIMFALNFVVLINNAAPTKLKLSFDDINEKSLNVTLLLPTHKYTCYEPAQFFAIWDIIHIIMYSLLPFVIILIENVILAFLTMQHAKQMKKSFGASSVCGGTKSLASMLTRNNVTNGPRSAIGINFETDGTIESHSDSNIQGFCARCWNCVASLFDKRKRIYRKSVNLRKAEEKNDQESETFKKNFTEVLLIQAKRNKKQQSKGSQVANLLLFLTLSFVICTVPYSTFYALKLNLNMDSPLRNIVINVLSLLQYMRHAGNFLIYLATSSILKHEIKFIYRNLKSRFSEKVF